MCSVPVGCCGRAATATLLVGALAGRKMCSVPVGCSDRAATPMILLVGVLAASSVAQDPIALLALLYASSTVSRWSCLV